MTVLYVDQERLFHFREIEDVEEWMFRHYDECGEIVIIQEDEYDEKFQLFLEENAPIEIINK